MEGIKGQAEKVEEKTKKGQEKRQKGYDEKGQIKVRERPEQEPIT